MRARSAWRSRDRVRRSDMLPPSGPRLRAGDRTDELLHAIGGLDAEALAQQTPTEAVLADRLAGIPVRKVYADERAVCAFAQRLGGHAAQTGLEGLAQP